jgi:hypothetical protein
MSSSAKPRVVPAAMDAFRLPFIWQFAREKGPPLSNDASSIWPFAREQASLPEWPFAGVWPFALTPPLVSGVLASVEG